MHNTNITYDYNDTYRYQKAPNNISVFYKFMQNKTKIIHD